MVQNINKSHSYVLLVAKKMCLQFRWTTTVCSTSTIVHNIVVHSNAENSSDKFPSYSDDRQTIKSADVIVRLSLALRCNRYCSECSGAVHLRGCKLCTFYHSFNRLIHQSIKVDRSATEQYTDYCRRYITVVKKLEKVKRNCSKTDIEMSHRENTVSTERLHQ